MDDPEPHWLTMVLLYTRHWIHFGAIAFFVVVIVAGAIRALLGG